MSLPTHEQEQRDLFRLLWSEPMIDGIGTAFFSGRQAISMSGWCFLMGINTPDYDAGTYHAARFGRKLPLNQDRLWLTNLSRSTIKSLPSYESAGLLSSDALGFCINQIVKELRGFQENGPESCKMAGEVVGMFCSRMGIIENESDIQNRSVDAPYGSFLYKAASQTRAIAARLYQPDMAAQSNSADPFFMEKMGASKDAFDVETDLHGDMIMNASVNYVKAAGIIAKAAKKNVIPFGLVDLDSFRTTNKTLSEMMETSGVEQGVIYGVHTSSPDIQRVLSCSNDKFALSTELHLRLLHAMNLNPMIAWEVRLQQPSEINPDSHCILPGMLLLEKELDANSYVDQKVAEAAISSLNSIDGRKPHNVSALWIDGLMRYLAYTEVQTILIEGGIADAYRFLGFCGSGRLRLQFIPGSYIGKGPVFNSLMLSCVKAGVMTTGKVIAANRDIIMNEDAALYLRACACNIPSRALEDERERHIRLMESRFESEVISETVRADF